MQISYTRRAVRHLNAAFAYIREQNPQAAIGVINRIEASIGNLAVHPNMGRKGRIAGTREIIVPGTPFLVAYRVDENQIQVLAIMHGARRSPSSFD